MNKNDQSSSEAVLEPDSVDMKTLGSLRELMEGRFTELIDLFLENVPRQLGTLKTSSKKGDAVTIFRSAHDLKSSSANLGANRLSGHCEVLETIGRAGTTEGSTDVIKRIEIEFVNVKSILQLEAKKVY